MRIIKDTNIQFMSQKKLGALLSGTVIILGIISLILAGGPLLSIDFKGGTLLAVHFEEPVDVNEFRSAMSNVNIDGQSFDFSKAEIKLFGGPNDISIRIPHMDQEPENFAQKIIKFLKDSFSNKIPESDSDFILSIEKVGPKIGAELSNKAILAILSSLGLILFYISIRFEFNFALGAIAALTHDVFVTLGIFSIMGYEISLPIIAAFLTIVGYSLNDTIVIFDRVRENVKSMKRLSYSEIIDKSINDSLSRTIVTSITTFIVVLILWLFGGEVINLFAFAMMVGVIVGTYSSIFVACPLVLRLQSKTQ
ncbi:MAG: protein translocase subunit SecF [Candidatus Neomarinimicrobiota bacterium]|jgi:preprotein translocase SecF subunit|nr:protein translocase subunit SecF [Candidatus Neomarinimicrobiota bacterium]MEC7935109.1 protein translocase subunit SecF [Candidatus Neomarinimicrobiota bacterium]MED5256626.1 protein translocase subunit SecF [Candidatus Neomarinimicrobiota bacterium]|tara:strand:- start:542 stop:1468 length:927 start_codon:yes stop_codon:yes gene_type:complete